MGFGTKTDFVNKETIDPGAYEVVKATEPKKRSISFGIGREVFLLEIVH